MIFLCERKRYYKYAIKKCKSKQKGVIGLNVKARILALKLLEQQKKYPETAKQNGFYVQMKDKIKKKNKR